MKNRFTIFSYIKRNLINTRNIILTLISTLLMVILFFALTFLDFTIKSERYIKTNYMKDLNIEVIRKTPYFNNINEYINYISSTEHNNIYKEEYDNLSNYKHVISNLPIKINDEVLLRFKGYENQDNPKEINIKVIYNKDNIKLINGNYPKKGEIVCPTKLYPYVLTKSILNMNIIEPNKIIDTNKELGNTYDLVEFRWNTGTNIDVKNSRYNNDIKLKLVGTYDNKYSFDSMDTCYTAFETYDLFRDCESYTTIGNGLNKETICMPYNGRVLTADSKENVSSIINNLQENGYDTSIKGQIEINSTSYMYPIIISLVTMIMTVTIILLNINKKCINKTINFAILQATGFRKKQIINIELLDNTIIYLISYVLSLILYYLLLIYLSNNLFSGYFFFGQNFEIPYVSIIIIYILISLIIYIFSIIKLNEILKKDIMINLEGN